MKYCFVSYDIPDNSKIGNPSWKFRRIGIRVNLSVWIVPQHLVPLDLLDRMRAKGAVCKVYPYDESASEMIKADVRDAMIAELENIQTGLQESIERAEAKFAAVCREDFDPKEDEKREKRIRASRNRAKRYLVAAQEASVAFMILADVQELIAGTAKAIQAEIELRVAEKTLFNEVACA